MKEVLTCSVKNEWIDYNGHMNDSMYAKVFSMGGDKWMHQIGITADFRESEKYTLFTLETHLCYLKETKENEDLIVKLQLLDHDAKRTHVFLVMINANGERVATSEQMFMGIDTLEGRPAPFPEPIINQLNQIAKEQKEMEQPKEVGRMIGIRRK